MQTRIAANYLDRSDKKNRIIVNISGAVVQTGNVVATDVSFESANREEARFGCTQVALTDAPVTIFPEGSVVQTGNLVELHYYCGYITVNDGAYQPLKGVKTLAVVGGKMFARL